MSGHKAVISVAVGVLMAEGAVWIQRRRGADHLTGLWEFPGGKVESGETPSQALLREIQEETGLEMARETAEIGDPFLIQAFDYPDRSLEIHFFLCPLESAVDLRGGRWLDIRLLHSEDFPEANRILIDKLRTLARK